MCVCLWKAVVQNRADICCSFSSQCSNKMCLLVALALARAILRATVAALLSTGVKFRPAFWCACSVGRSLQQRQPLIAIYVLCAGGHAFATTAKGPPTFSAESINMRITAWTQLTSFLVVTCDHCTLEGRSASSSRAPFSMYRGTLSQRPSANAEKDCVT